MIDSKAPSSSEEPQDKKWYERTWYHVLLIAGGIALFVLAGAWILDWYIDPKTSGQKKDLVQALGLITAGVAGAVGIYFTWRGQRQARQAQEENQQATQAQLENAQEELRLTRQGQITERFTRAIDQLGSESLEIRLGGIYSLERTAHEDRDYHWPILEVLSSYVRKRVPKKSDIEHQWDLPATEPDIQAILTVIGRRCKQYKDVEYGRIDLAYTDLRGVPLKERYLWRADLSGAYLWESDLTGADLSEADLTWAKLQGVRLEGANLQRANLQYADLRNADLTDANLKQANLSAAYLGNPEPRQDGAILQRADLRGASLRGASAWGAALDEANLQGANLRNASFTDAVLRDADLRQAVLWGANLQRAFLRGANLQGADLRNVDLRNVDLTDANLKQANLKGTNLSDATFTQEQLGETIGDESTVLPITKLPPYLKRPAHWGVNNDEQAEGD